MVRVAVLMLRDRGSNFRGEKVFFEDDRANELVRQKVCLLLDENGEPIIPEEGVVEVAGGNTGGNTGNEGNGSGNGGNTDGGKPDAKKKPKGKGKGGELPNPFAIDGFDPKIIAALAEAGINNPEELRAYVASGKTLAELPVIGVVTEKELLDLYGEEPE
jgi:hypothetical protein